MNNEVFTISYKDFISGENFTHRTNSTFIAERLVSNIIHLAERSRVPLWKTKLKVVTYKKDRLECSLTINPMTDAMFRMVFHYN